MQAKKFIPCIYLYQGMAVNNPENKEAISMNPIELALTYTTQDTDSLLIFDLSTTDAEHEKAIEIIKKIASKIEVPLLVGGNIHRIEDVKKLLYAACYQVVLDYSISSNIKITEEVSKRFGKGRLIVSVDSIDTLKTHLELIDKFCSEILLTNSASLSKELLPTITPIITLLPEISLDKLFTHLSFESISGITGPMVNKNIKDLFSIKALCKERGILVKQYIVQVPWLNLK